MFIKKKSLLIDSQNIAKDLEKILSLDKDGDIEKFVDKFNELFNKKNINSKNATETKKSIQKEKEIDIDTSKKQETFKKVEGILKTSLQNSSKETEDKNNTSFISLGDEILKGMTSSQNNYINTSSEIGDSKSISNLTSKEIASFISSVANRILVSTNNVEGSAEARISLKDNILPETEVKILRDNDKLTVEFITFSQKSEELLISNKELLEGHLKENFKPTNISVTINFIKNDSFSSNSDGRSRGQRHVYEEMEKREE
ncbi:type III secretion HpaP family protein [Desulfothermus sp.]